MRCLVLGAVMGAGGCASVEYRVPTWEVQRLTQLPPAIRGEVRIIPADAVVPPPPALVAEAPPPPEVDIDVDVPLIVAPRPVVVVAPRPEVVPRRTGTTVGAGPRTAPPAASGWKSAAPGSAGGWRPAAVSGRSTPTPTGRSGGGFHGGHSGGGGAGAAAGAVAAVALIAIVADAAVTAAQADAARRYDGWVAVDANHPLHLFYGRGPGRVVPLAQLGPADLIGLQNAVLVEGDGHVAPLRLPPLPVAGPPLAPVPPAPAAGAWGSPGATSTPSAPAHAAPPAVATPPPMPVAPPAPVSQLSDPETP